MLLMFQYPNTNNTNRPTWYASHVLESEYKPSYLICFSCSRIRIQTVLPDMILMFQYPNTNRPTWYASQVPVSEYKPNTWYASRVPVSEYKPSYLICFSCSSIQIQTVLSDMLLMFQYPNTNRIPDMLLMFQYPNTNRIPDMLLMFQYPNTNRPTWYASHVPVSEYTPLSWNPRSWQFYPRNQIRLGLYVQLHTGPG